MLIYFDVIFVCDVRYIYFCIYLSYIFVLATFFLNFIIFHWITLTLLLETHFPCWSGFISEFSIPFYWSTYLCLCQFHISLLTEVILEIRQWKFSNFVLPLPSQSYLGYFKFFDFHINCRISLSLFTKEKQKDQKTPRNLKWF